MAERWLKRLELVDNVARSNRDRRRPCIFDYGKHNEEQFRSRYQVPKDAFRELLDIISPDISAHNDRGKTFPADIQLLLTLRFYATGTLQLACGDFCEISEPSASQIIKRVSEAIARLRNNYITFPEGAILDEFKRDFWRICVFPNAVGAIDCTQIKILCPGKENAELFRNQKGYFSINVQAVWGPNLKICKHCRTLAR